MKRWFGGMMLQLGIPADKKDVLRAIALAESQGIADMYGDIHLQGGQWGPSVGLFQIRTLVGETGKGSDRDIQRVSNPLENTRAAWAISRQGMDFSPWSVFNNSSYKAFMPGGPSYKADFIVDFGPWEAEQRQRDLIDGLKALANVLLTSDREIKAAIGVVGDEVGSRANGIEVKLGDLPSQVVEEMKQLRAARQTTETFQWVEAGIIS